MILLAGASQGMMLLSDDQGGSVGWIEVLEGTNETSRSEWVLPIGKGMDATRKQYLKMELHAITGDGFAGFFFGSGPKPQFSLFISGGRTLLLPQGEYPAAEFFELEGERPREPHAPLNWRAQVWPTSKWLRIITPEGETRLPLADPSLSNPSWQNGLARLLVSNASVTLYRLAGVDVPTLFMIR